EERAGQMKSADDGIHLLDSRQLLRVTNGIDRPRMPTAGEDHEPLVLDMHHHGLVVMDQGVPLPLACNTSVVDRKPLLEGSRTVDLPRHQHKAPQEIRWPSLFDELDALVGEDTSIGRRKMELMAIGKNNFSFEERIRMQEQRHLALSQALDESHESPCVVAVPVAQLHPAHLFR